MENVNGLRLLVKVARLYHTHGRRQAEIAERLQISQSRVSRLLAQAEEAGIVRTVVAVPPHSHSELEESLQDRYGVADVHVIEAVSNDETERMRDLAYAMAALLERIVFKAPTVGFTSWSRTQRLMVSALQPLRTGTQRVVETLGDLGPPDLQHTAARSTQTLASFMDAEPVFLRTPGVVPSSEFRELLLSRDPYARQALTLLDSVDLALVGIGGCDLYPPLRSGENYFTREQLEDVQRRGAVGQVCLRFIDAEGGLVESPLDDLVIGITAEQIRSATRRWAVAGGPGKYPAIRAALKGGWVDTLVTDSETAAHLAATAETPTRISRKRAGAGPVRKPARRTAG